MGLEVSMASAAMATCICYFGSYLIASLCEQIRLLIVGKEFLIRRHMLTGLLSLVYVVVVVGSIIINGSGLKLQTNSGDEAKVHFDVSFIFLAIGVLLPTTLLGFYVSSGDRVYTKSKKQLFEMLMKELQEQSFAMIRNPSALLRHAIFTGCSHVLLGGSITGIGMCCAYFAIVCSLGGDVTVSVSVLYALLVAIAILTLSSLFHLLLFRVTGLFPTNESLRFICALVCTSVIVCCYWLVVCVSQFQFTPNASSSTHNIAQLTLFISMIVLCIGYQVCIGDARLQISQLTRSKQHHVLDNRESESDSVLVQLQMHVSKRMQAVEKRCRHVKVHPLLAHSSEIMTMDNRLSANDKRILSSHTASYDDYDNSQIANEV